MNSGLLSNVLSIATWHLEFKKPLIASIIVFGKTMSVVSMCFNWPRIHVFLETKTYLKNPFWIVAAECRPLFVLEAEPMPVPFNLKIMEILM